MNLNNLNESANIDKIGELPDNIGSIRNEKFGVNEFTNQFPEKKALNVKKIVWISIGSLVIGLMILIVYQLFINDWFKMHDDAPKNTPTETNAARVTNFYDLPEFIVNLSDGQDGVSYIRLELSLEVTGRENMQRVKQLEPKIQDILNIYLRELRLSDIKGTYGLYRLREELFSRINAVLAPCRIDSVLFKVIQTQ